MIGLIIYLHFILVWFVSLIWIKDRQFTEESQKHEWYWTMYNGTFNVILVSVGVWFWMQSRWVVLLTHNSQDFYNKSISGSSNWGLSITELPAVKSRDCGLLNTQAA